EVRSALTAWAEVLKIVAHTSILPGPYAKGFRFYGSVQATSQSSTRRRPIGNHVARAGRRCHHFHCWRNGRPPQLGQADRQRLAIANHSPGREERESLAADPRFR